MESDGYRSTSLVLILSKIHPFHTLPSLSLRCILVLFCHLRVDLPCVLFPSGFQSRTFYAIFCSLVCATFSTDLILRDLIFVIRFGEQYKSAELFIMHISAATYYFPVVVSRYLPEHLVLQNLQSVFFRQYDRPRFRIPVMRRKTIC